MTAAHHQFMAFNCHQIHKPNERFSFIHSRYFYSASSSPLLLRGTPDATRILCQSFTPKCHRQLRVKDLPKVPTRRLEWDLNPRPFGRKVMNLPMSHHAPWLSVLNDFNFVTPDIRNDFPYKALRYTNTPSSSSSSSVIVINTNNDVIIPIIIMKMLRGDLVRENATAYGDRARVSDPLLLCHLS